MRSFGFPQFRVALFGTRNLSSSEIAQEFPARGRLVNGRATPPIGILRTPH
jgi:hypothetical protein